jgi:hypothetical protein
MSYEHCDRHDEDATNGCPKCEAISVVAEARDRVAETLKICVDTFNTGARLSTGMHLLLKEAHLLQTVLVLTYLRGKRSVAGYSEWEAHVTAVLRGELE